MVHVIVRSETPQDLDAIRNVNIAAFAHHPYSQQTEHLIVEALRAADALESSLVAEIDGEVVGHIAFSAAGIGDTSSVWYLLGPVAVLPDHQRKGIGRALVGRPAFFSGFGFQRYAGVAWDGFPDENVLCLLMCGDAPVGAVSYHLACTAGTWAARGFDGVFAALVRPQSQRRTRPM